MVQSENHILDQVTQGCQAKDSFISLDGQENQGIGFYFLKFCYVIVD